MKKTYKEKFIEALTKEKQKYDKLAITIDKEGNYSPFDRHWLKVQYTCKAAKLNAIRETCKKLPASIFIPRRFAKAEFIHIKLACPEIQI